MEPENPFTELAVFLKTKLGTFAPNSRFEAKTIEAGGKPHAALVVFHPDSPAMAFTRLGEQSGLTFSSNR